MIDYDRINRLNDRGKILFQLFCHHKWDYFNYHDGFMEKICIKCNKKEITNASRQK